MKRDIENNQPHPLSDHCIESCKTWLAEIEQARERIVAGLQERLDTPGNMMRLALNQAEAIAWQTDYPHLVYPALAMEKIQSVDAWRSRQEQIKRSWPVLAQAA